MSLCNLFNIGNPDFVSLCGLCLNIIGAICIALFSEHGTSTLWKYKKGKAIGYFLFVFGFLI